MKLRPLLYKAPMVNATIDSLKTQTRRGINRLAGFGVITEFQKSETHGYDWTFRDKKMLWHDISHQQLLDSCPYGVIGDQLYVKETTTEEFMGSVSFTKYSADGYIVPIEWSYSKTTRPSIFCRAICRAYCLKSQVFELSD